MQFDFHFHFYIETKLKMVTNILFLIKSWSLFLVLFILYFFAMGFNEKRIDFGSKFLWIWIKTLLHYYVTFLNHRVFIFEKGFDNMYLDSSWWGLETMDVKYLVYSRH